MNAPREDDDRRRSVCVDQVWFQNARAKYRRGLTQRGEVHTADDDDQWSTYSVTAVQSTPLSRCITDVIATSSSDLQLTTTSSSR